MKSVFPLYYLLTNNKNKELTNVFTENKYNRGKKKVLYILSTSNSKDSFSEYLDFLKIFYDLPLRIWSPFHPRFTLESLIHCDIF